MYEDKERKRRRIGRHSESKKADWKDRVVEDAVRRGRLCVCVQET